MTCACLWLPSALRAQDLRDVVKQHVASELEPGEQKAESKPEPKAESKPEPKAEPNPKPAAKPEPKSDKPKAMDMPKDGSGFSLSTDAPRSADADLLPMRLFGKDFKFDITLGAGYRGWVPQQYDTVEVDAGSYYVWTIDVKAKLYRFLNLRRGYYESNGLSGPRTQEAAVASKVGSYAPKAAWLLGVIGVPISKAWEPIIRYESRAFQTEAKPSMPVCVVTKEVASDLSTCARTDKTLEMISGFETLVLGVRYDRSKQAGAVMSARKGKTPPMTFGVGLMSYRKPYQITIDGSTLSEYLFDGRFRGAGLAFGTEVGGGPSRLSLNLDSQVGLGEVQLTDGLTLNSLAPEDWLIGYVQGNVTVSYAWPIWRAAPTLMFVPSATGGGASFFFFKAEQDPKAKDQSDSATVNWDFLWSVHATLVLTL